MPLRSFPSALHVQTSIENQFRKSFDETARIGNRVIGQIDPWRLTAVLLIALLCYSISVLWFWGSVWRPNYSVEPAKIFAVQDVRVQSTFYYLFCASTFLIFISIGVLRPYLYSVKIPTIPNWANIKNIKIKNLPHQYGWLHIGAYCLLWWAIYSLGMKSILFFLVMIAAARLFEMALLNRITKMSLGWTFLATIILFYVVPWTLNPFVPTGLLWAMDIHWSAIFGNALIQESLSGNEISSFASYGFLSNYLVSEARYLMPFRSLAGTQDLFFLINIFFFGLILWIVKQRITVKNDLRFLAISILILISFSITIAGYSHYFKTPNQLPIRFLMIPCSVILAYYLGKLSIYKNAAANGFLAPILISYNFEIGLFCMLGLGFAMFLKCAKGGIVSVIISGVIYSLTFAIAGALLMVLILGEVSQENTATLFQEVSRVISYVAGGWGGLQPRFYPSYIICMTHIFVLFAGYLMNIRNHEKLSEIDYQNAVIVGIIIATGTYMMNRFASINMWIPLLLYILLLVPKLCSNDNTDKLMWPLIILLLIVPINYTGIKWLGSSKAYTYISQRTSSQNKVCIDGFEANIELCDYLDDKIGELQSLLLLYPDLQWSSALKLTISRLTGLRGAVEDNSLIFSAGNNRKRAEIVNRFRKLNSKIVVIDKIHNKNPAGIPTLTETFRLRIINEAGYRYLRETKYWIVAEQIQH